MSSNPEASGERKVASEGEQRIQEDLGVKKELEKKSKGEKREETSKDSVRGDTFDKLIDKN